VGVIIVTAVVVWILFFRPRIKKVKKFSRSEQLKYC
jgi:hypothetical protein